MRLTRYYPVLFFVVIAVQWGCDYQSEDVTGSGTQYLGARFRTEADCLTLFSCRLTAYEESTCIDFPTNFWTAADAEAMCQDLADLVGGQIDGWSDTSCADDNFNATWRCKVAAVGVTLDVPVHYIYLESLPIEICASPLAGIVEERPGDAWTPYTATECVPICDDEVCWADEEDEEQDCTTITATVNVPDDFNPPATKLAIGLWEPSDLVNLPPTTPPGGGLLVVESPTIDVNQPYDFNQSVCVKASGTDYQAVLVLYMSSGSLLPVAPADYWWVAPTAATYYDGETIDLGDVDLLPYP